MNLFHPADFYQNNMCLKYQKGLVLNSPIFKYDVFDYSVEAVSLFDSLSASKFDYSYQAMKIKVKLLTSKN